MAIFILFWYNSHDSLQACYIEGTGHYAKTTRTMTITLTGDKVRIYTGYETKCTYFNMSLSLSESRCFRSIALSR